MARVSKTYAPSDVFDGSTLGRPLRDEQQPTFTNGRDWSISRDSLINGRPASVIPLARRYDKRKKRKCCSVTKMELLLISVSTFLLTAAVGIIIAWSIVSKGFRYTNNDKLPIENRCVPDLWSNDNTNRSTPVTAGSLICTSEACARLAINFLDNLNPAAHPCDDFYEFACGGFVKHHDIPNDKPYYNVISGVDQKLYRRLKTLLQSSISPSDGVPVQQVKTLYQACEKDSADNNDGARPLLKLLDNLGGWPVLNPNWTFSHRDGHNFSWERATIDLLKSHGKTVLLEMSVVLDPINTSWHIIQFDQVHLGLDNKIYYLNGTDNYLLQAYYKLMVESSVLFGASRSVAEKDMQDVVRLEIKLAKIATSEDQRRDPVRLYNRYKKLELKPKFPNINFDILFNGTFPIPINDDHDVVVVEKSYLEVVGETLRNEPPRTIYNYLLWRLVQDYLNLLPAKYRDPLYNFRSVHFGTSARTARWEECVALTRAVVPMIVGSIYVREYFKEESKIAVKNVCQTLKKAFIDEFDNLDWMDSVTKKHAIAKANNLKYHIGYPDWIFNDTKLLEPLEGIKITMNNILESVSKIRSRKFQMNVLKLTEPMDPDFWFESPALVDAYYVPPRNEMVFPAGIIQFPFFLAGGPTFVTFATVGTVVGHEIVHGFDDEGRHYDENGNLHKWWDSATANKFQAKTDCLAKQYGSILVPEINKTLNGRLTLGENIADNVALMTAFNAFQLWTKTHGEEPKLPGLDHYTNEQLFFIAYANNWCSVTRPEYYEYSIFNDPHSPSKYRTIVPLKNFPPFSEAFQCDKTRAMNSQQRCTVW